MDNTHPTPQDLSPADYADELADFGAAQSHEVKARAIEKTQKFRSYAGERAAAIKQEAGVKLKQGADKAKEIHTTVEEYVKENPTNAILSAVGVGVIIGLIMRR